VARRYEVLSREISELEAHLERLVAQAAPELVSLPGIGTDSAATLLIVVLKTTPRDWGAKPPSPICAGSHPSQGLLRKGRSPPSQPRRQQGGQSSAVYDLPVSDAPG